jgi:hypothetical protein
MNFFCEAANGRTWHPTENAGLHIVAILRWQSVELAHLSPPRGIVLNSSTDYHLVAAWLNYEHGRLDTKHSMAVMNVEGCAPTTRRSDSEREQTPPRAQPDSAMNILVCRLRKRRISVSIEKQFGVTAALVPTSMAGFVNEKRKKVCKLVT